MRAIPKDYISEICGLDPAQMGIEPLVQPHIQCILTNNKVLKTLKSNLLRKNLLFLREESSRKGM